VASDSTTPLATRETSASGDAGASYRAKGVARRAWIEPNRDARSVAEAIALVAQTSEAKPDRPDGISLAIVSSGPAARTVTEGHTLVVPRRHVADGLS